MKKQEKKVVRVVTQNGVLFSDVCRDEELARGLFYDWLSIIANRFPNGRIGDGSSDEQTFVHTDNQCIGVMISYI